MWRREKRENLPDFVFPVYVFDGLCWDFVLFLDLWEGEIYYKNGTRVNLITYIYFCA